jgi:hypothetical protein
MTLYTMAVFLHVVGALGLFAALGLEWAALRGMRRSVTIDHVRPWVWRLGSLRRLAGLSALTILITGIYLSATTWGRQPWIGLGLLGLALIGAIGPVLTGRRMRGIARSLPVEDGPLPSPLLRRAHDPVLLLSASLRTALALGVVFLMTVKPGSASSLVAMGVSLAIGAGPGALAWLGVVRQPAPNPRS